MTTPGQGYGQGGGAVATAPPPPAVVRPADDGPPPGRGRLGGSSPLRRLWTMGSLLALLAVVFGVLTVTQVVQSSNAATSVVDHSQPLSDDAAQIFHSLADADTTAATGFLQAGNETAAVQKQYNSDINMASTLLAKAAGSTATDDPGQTQIRQLNAQLPVYTGLVETARADDRQGLPLGGAYLRFASSRLQDEMLPEAKQLYTTETARLHHDYADAQALPWASIGLGLVLLAALIWAQIRLFRGTNRVFNVGLLAASAFTAAGLIWLGTAQSLAASDLRASNTRGAAPLQVLNEAQITALQCRGAENLNLVARGSTTDYQTLWQTVSKELAGQGGYLTQALQMTGDDATAQQQVQAAVTAFATWDKRHDVAGSANNNGEYTTAVSDTIGVPGAPVASANTTDAAFTSLNSSLAAAISHEQANFASLAADGRGATTLLAEGAGVLAALAAAGALLGINRRAAEYR